MHVYNEYADWRYDMINEGRDDERAETKKWRKGKSIFSQALFHAEKNSTNRSAKMHDSDRHFRLEKFFVNCCAHVGKNKKKWLPLHSHYIPASIADGDSFSFSQKLKNYLLFLYNSQEGDNDDANL